VGVIAPQQVRIVQQADSDVSSYTTASLMMISLMTVIELVDANVVS